MENHSFQSQFLFTGTNTHLHQVKGIQKETGPLQKKDHGTLVHLPLQLISFYQFSRKMAKNCNRQMSKGLIYPLA